MQYDPGAQSLFRRVLAVLSLRCPRCCEGPVWRAPFRMHERCPVCALQFEREPGYFTGAMYASYMIGIGLTLPVWMTLLLGGAGLGVTLAVAIGMIICLAPVSFHYSRVAWMHVDCYFNPKTFEADPGA